MMEFPSKGDARQPGIFRPDAATVLVSTKGKQSQAEAITVYWPQASRKQQEDTFWTWHSVAMQICERASVDLRVLAILHRFIFWQSGAVNATNRQMANQAGQCSEKTISRCVNEMIRLGLFRSTMAYNPDTRKTRRRLVLSYPLTLPEGVYIVHDDD